MRTGNRQTVLIVDDDKLILNMLFNLLVQEYRVLLADTVKIARGILEADPQIDLVMTDYSMPDVNGLQLLNQIRKSHPHVKRILMSGKIGLETVTNTVNHEMAHRIVTKPWDDKELIEILYEVLQRPTPMTHALSENQKVLVSGFLRGMSVSDVLCLLSTNKKNGILNLKSDRLGDGKIFLKEGRIVNYSNANSEKGMNLEQLIERNEGSYYFIEDRDYVMADSPVASQPIMII